VVKNMLMAMTVLALGACATLPDPPGCAGSYRSLNPTHYTLQDTGHEAVQTTLTAS
jgi:hypothetical protein